MTFVAVALAVARKDLRAEFRGRELLPALLQFVVLALVIAIFAFGVDHRREGGPGPDQVANLIAPGVGWLVLIFAGLVAFGRAFSSERESGSMEAMLLTGAPAAAVFTGKALTSALLLAAVELILLAGMAVFLGATVTLTLGAVLLASTVGIAALGSLFAALAAQTRARDLLLPALALPLWLPFVAIGGGALQTATGGPATIGQPLLVLLDLGILFWVAAALAARVVLDD